MKPKDRRHTVNNNITLIENEHIITNPKKVCDIFNDYFISAAEDLKEKININTETPIDEIVKAYADHPSINKIVENAGILNNFKFDTVSYGRYTSKS